MGFRRVRAGDKGVLRFKTMDKSKSRQPLERAINSYRMTNTQGILNFVSAKGLGRALEVADDLSFSFVQSCFRFHRRNARSD